ncbi:hypothetical protein RB195_017957 [Necator americanus]|uniref:Uncharacterized protein n=1 Tax=Necator americanus TaxID=51031 RepID=A0ABR1C9K9_NECAM
MDLHYEYARDYAQFPIIFLENGLIGSSFFFEVAAAYATVRASCGLARLQLIIVRPVANVECAWLARFSEVLNIVNFVSVRT